jgi:hypothetical protein
MREKLQSVSRPDGVAGAAERVRRGSVRRREWDELSSRLADTLEILEDGHYLVLGHRPGPYYVQVAVDPDGMRMEAISNRFLEGWQRLDATATDRLRRLGWKPPADIGDGPPNWWRHFGRPFPLRLIASLMTATLNRAFDVARVDHLEYKAFTRAGETILLPQLGVERRIDKSEATLAERVDAYFGELLQADEVVHDPDGDIPIRWDDHVVYVRVEIDPDYVRVFSPVLHDLEITPGLLDALNEINLETRIARFVADRAGVVVVSADIADTGAVEGPLGEAYNAVGALAAHYAGILQARFGGATFFGSPVQPPGRPATGFYL